VDDVLILEESKMKLEETIKKQIVTSKNMGLNEKKD